MAEKNPFRHPEAIDGGVEAAEIHRVFEKNMVKVKSEIGAKALEERVHEAVDAHQSDKSTFELDLQILDELVEDYNVSEGMKEVFLSTEKLFERVNVTPPTPQEFMRRGIDFTAMGEAWRTMFEEGLNPQIIIAAYPKKPHHWNELYDDLSQDWSLRNSSGLLSMADEIIKNWNKFSEVPLTSAGRGPNLRLVRSEFHHEDKWGTDQTPGLMWTIRIVSGTAEPTLCNTGYYDRKTHLSLSEYLTLQALIIQDDKEMPVDRKSETWLATKRPSFQRAATGRWNMVSGQIEIRTYGAQRKEDTLGVRRIWGR